MWEVLLFIMALLFVFATADIWIPLLLFVAFGVVAVAFIVPVAIVSFPFWLVHRLRD